MQTKENRTVNASMKEDGKIGNNQLSAQEKQTREGLGGVDGRMGGWFKRIH